MARLAFFGDGVWATKSLEAFLARGHSVPLVVLRGDPTDKSLAGLAKQAGIAVGRTGE